jgi:hypothetical protein
MEKRPICTQQNALFAGRIYVSEVKFIDKGSSRSAKNYNQRIVVEIVTVFGFAV